MVPVWIASFESSSQPPNLWCCDDRLNPPVLLRPRACNIPAERCSDWRDSVSAVALAPFGAERRLGMPQRTSGVDGAMAREMVKGT